MIKQNLIITYSNQRARELKSNSEIVKPIDKVITLDDFILEEFEKKSFKIVIDEIIGSSILYKIIQSNPITYFDYLKPDDDSLNTIYDFIVKCNRNEVSFDTLLQGKKLKAVEVISSEYQQFKEKNNLVDIADIEKWIYNNFNSKVFNKFEEVLVDDFCKVDPSFDNYTGIRFEKSKLQEKILNEKIAVQKFRINEYKKSNPKIIKPKHEVFDTIDEVKTAIKIARKLMESGVKDDEILIVTTAIEDYAPLYKIFLDEYGMKGYSSLGTRLNCYYNSQNIDVKNALLKYESQIKELESIYERLDLELTDSLEEKVKYQITIKDEKVGIEITDANQLLGSSKRYKHIIFIGADINHFPPKAKDSFLCSYDDEIKYFYKDDFFLSSQIQYEEIKTLCNNLYIISASYSGKRELSPSIIIDKKFDEIIDISEIISVNELAYNNQTLKASSKSDEEFYLSVKSKEFTKFDGVGVEGIKASYLSASQINRYNSCPLLYLYTNKLKLQAPGQEEEGFDAAEQGSLMHLCFELFGIDIKQKAVKDESFEDINYRNLMFNISLEAYQQFMRESELKENINHKVFLSTLQSGLKDDREDGLLAKFVDYFQENKEELEYFKHSEFEKEFALDSELKPYNLKDTNDRNYFIKGFIDRFDNLDKYVNIIDYKSKKVNKIDKDKLDQIRELKDIQLALYILYASQEYPNKEYYSSLLSFKTSQPYAFFANLSNINDIKDTEYYSDEYEKDLKQLIFGTKENIEMGIFNFNNSDEKNCEWCDIKFMCHSNLLNKESNE